MMKTTITKYIVVRTTWSNAKCSYVRTANHFDDEAEAIDWAERHSTRDHITCKVFAVECKVKEDGTVCYPCDWSKNALPSVSVENVGTLIYRKQGKEVHDFREQEAVKEFLADDEAETEPEREEEAFVETAEPVELAFDAPADEAKYEAPAAQVTAGELVRWYVVLKIAENRKQTRFHLKRRMFYDDEAAIQFARSRLRGGCKEAAVYLYDPVSVKEPPMTFESDNVQRDARNIMALLWNFEIYYVDRTAERDLRSGTFKKLADYKGATA